MTDNNYEFMMAYYRGRIEDYTRLRDEICAKPNSNGFNLSSNYKRFRTYLTYTQLIKQHQKWMDELSKQHN